MDHIAVGIEVIDIDIGVVIRGGEVQHHGLALRVVIGLGLRVGADLYGVPVVGGHATIEDAVRLGENLAASLDRRIYVAGGLFLAIEYAVVAKGGRAEELEFF